METVSDTHDPVRGEALILEHCAALARLGDGRPPAALRLEELVGCGLARLLVGALAGDHPMRSRDLAA